MSEKIPVELLLKYSRREVGELKSEIDELKDIIAQKDKKIKSLSDKLTEVRRRTVKLSPKEQVKLTLTDINKELEKTKNLSKYGSSKRAITMYKRVSRFYNYYYDTCKSLLSILKELRNIHTE
jgi:chromosome segregation ATPase